MIATVKPEKKTLTYSSIQCFRTCPKKYQNRYLEGLVPKEKDDCLYFGTVIHHALETWYGLYGQAYDLRCGEVLRILDEQCKDRETDTNVLKIFLQASAMMRAYMEHYRYEQLDIQEVEMKFTGTIRNPDTGAESRTFDMAGKVDLVTNYRDKLYIVEHKTRSSMPDNEEEFLDELWADTQIHLYANYLRQNGLPVVGVIYNILCKPTIKQKFGETEEEFNIRYAELAAKNKNGKSTAKRQLPESDAEYAERLDQWYSEKSRFFRVDLLLSQDRLAMVEREVWSITKQYLEQNRRNEFFCNTDSCFNWGRPCDYFPYCKSGYSKEMKEQLFGITEDVHPEFLEWSAND